MSITVCTRGSERDKKDTLRNIEETKQFVVNIMSEWFVDAANATSGDFPPEVDEIQRSGLGTLESVHVSPPRIAEAAVHLECEVSPAPAHKI